MIKNEISTHRKPQFSRFDSEHNLETGCPDDNGKAAKDAIAIYEEEKSRTTIKAPGIAATAAPITPLSTQILII